jgi:hypothetical protein
MRLAPQPNQRPVLIVAALELDVIEQNEDVRLKMRPRYPSQGRKCG